MSVSAGIICAILYLVINFLDPYMLSWACLNRPLVVAPLTGLLLGDFHTGIVMGASLEAIFMGISAVGGSVPSDNLSGTIIPVAYAILVGGESSVETGLALALTIGTIMSSFSAMLTPVWAALAPYWEKLAQECNPKKFKAQALLVNVVSTLPGSIVIFVAVAYGVAGLQNALAALPAWVLTGLGAAGGMMTAVGFGILLSMIWNKEICVFYFVGFILCKSLNLSSLGIAVIGNIVSIVFGYVFILGVGSFEVMGIVGAAITNNLRIVVMFFIGLHLLFGKNGVLADYSSKKMPFDFKAFKELIIFGVPTAIGNSFWNFAALFLSNFILSYGESYFAAYQLGLQCEGF